MQQRASGGKIIKMASLLLIVASILALPGSTFARAAATNPDECATAKEVRADLEAWKAELATKGLATSRITDLLSQLKLRTGYARELPDVDQGTIGTRSITIESVEDLKAKLSGRASPEHVIVVKYRLMVGKSCGEHEDHCFEGYAIQVLRPMGRSLWCSFGSDLSAEIWGPDRDYAFCPESRNPARDFAFFALTRPGRKVIQLDDYRAHCPSSGARTSHHDRSYWEIQEGSLGEIFSVTVHAQSGGPDFGKLNTVRGRLSFSGDFPKLIHFEAEEEACGADVFSENERKARAACRKSERFQVYHYASGHYSPEAASLH